MDTKELARHYPSLRPAERVPLIVAASLRGDEVEKRRLTESAPTVNYQVPNYYPWAIAHQKTERVFLETILDLCANFWFCWGVWMADGQRPGHGRIKKQSAGRAHRPYGVVRYLAYRLTTHLDAWKQFAAERHFEALAPLKISPSWKTVETATEHARELAFSAKEAVAFLVADAISRGEEPPEVAPAVETVPALVKEWHEAFDQMLLREGG